MRSLNLREVYLPKVRQQVDLLTCIAYAFLPYHGEQFLLLPEQGHNLLLLPTLKP